MSKTVVMSINTSWNIFNFRRGLISRLQREGFDVVTLAPKDAYTESLTALGVCHYSIDIDRKGLSPIRDLLLGVQYYRILRDVRPAVFLGWTVKPNIYGSLAAHILGIPVINNISGLGTPFMRTGWLTLLVRALYRLALIRSKTIFFQNPYDRDLFIKQGLVAISQVMLLPGSGIDLAQFVPVVGQEPLTPTFLMIARLIRDKGVVEFADAARIVRETRPGVIFELLGFLDLDNRTAIDRDTIESWERDGILRYCGEVTDVRPYLAKATAVVLPSYREGMPRSLLEAAAMGKPLIATDVPGCTEIARAGENAILCNARDARSLAEAIVEMVDATASSRARMGRRSRVIAETEFDIRFVEERYCEAIGLATIGKTNAKPRNTVA